MDTLSGPGAENLKGMFSRKQGPKQEFCFRSGIEDGEKNGQRGPMTGWGAKSSESCYQIKYPKK